jgi:hypothetical protein
MGKILAVVIVLFAQVINTGGRRKVFTPSGCGAIGNPCTDNFPGTSLSGNWTLEQGTVAVAAGNVTLLTGGAFSRVSAAYTGVTFTPNQFAQATQSAAGGGAGPSVLASSSGVYYLECTSSTLVLYRLVYPSSATGIGSGGACSVGAVLWLGDTVSGSNVTLTAKVNGSVVSGINGVVDSGSSVLTGSPGFGLYATSTLSVWSGGDQ